MLKTNLKKKEPTEDNNRQCQQSVINCNMHYSVHEWIFPPKVRLKTVSYFCLCVAVFAPGDCGCKCKTTPVFVVGAEVTRPTLTFAVLFQWWAFVTLWRPMCGNRLLTIAQVSSRHAARAPLFSLSPKRKPAAMKRST